MTLAIFDAPVDALTIGHDFRIDDDPEQMAGLIASISEHGILSPLLVRATTQGYEVIAGRRRLAAARQVGLATVPVIERNLDDHQAEDIALAENLHRRQLSPIEEALGYLRLRHRGLSQVQIADRTGRSQTHVSRHLRLLDLPERARGKVHLGLMSIATALDERPNRPTGRRQGARPGLNPQPQDETAIITHWRRRHDRLIAGINQALDRLPSEHRPLLRTLLHIDLTPLDPLPSDAADRKPTQSQLGRRGSAPPPTTRKATSRRCAGPSCNAILSVHNTGTLCAACDAIARRNPRAFRSAAR